MSDKIEAAEQRYFVGEDGVATPMPPPGLSARKRLDWVNALAAQHKPQTEPAVSDAELGMRREAFNQLPARRRLEIANNISAARKARNES